MGLLVLVFRLFLLFPHKIIHLQREKVQGSVDTYRDLMHTKREKREDSQCYHNCQPWVQLTDYHKGVLEISSG